MRNIYKATVSLAVLVAASQLAMAQSGGGGQQGSWVQTAYSSDQYNSHVQAVSAEGTPQGIQRSATATRALYWSVSGAATNEPSWDSILTPLRSLSAYVTINATATAYCFDDEYVEVLLTFTPRTASETFYKSSTEETATRNGSKEIYTGSFYKVTSSVGDHSGFPTGWTSLP